MKKVLFLISVAMLVLGSCRKDDDTSELDLELESLLIDLADGNGLAFFTFPASTELTKIPQDPKNPLTTAKIELGKLLFHETATGVNPVKAFSKGTYSCASCHFAAAGFQAGRFQGIGEGGIGIGPHGEARQRGPLYTADDLDVQPVRSPSALNIAYQTNILWNGQFGATGVNTGLDYAFTPGTPKETNTLGFEGVETQAIAGQKVHRLDMTAALAEELGYKAMFDAAFPDVPVADRYTKITAGLAIAAYERTIFSQEAPFQKWLKGQKNAMNEQEKRGAILFFDKAKCAECHTGPALNSMEFYGIGMGDLFDCPEEIFKANAGQSDHLGRGGFTGKAEDKYKFKVPQLYNMSDSPFFGHGSSLRTIRDVVVYKNRAVKENARVPDAQLAEEFVPLNLTNAEIDDITAFLKHALYDPDLKRYQPSSVKSGNCIPNNDPMSRTQLGCD
jgi:cytochrome c peroxidase